MAEKDEEQTPAEEKPKPKRTRKPAAAKEGQKAEGKKAEAKAEGEKPKPKRTRKPAAPKAEKAKAEAAKAEETKADEAKADEAKAEETKAAEAPKAETTEEKPQPGGRRRGGAAAAGRSRSARAARRSPEGDVTVRARAKYVRCAPRKARLVIDHIRGKDVDHARAILMHTQRAASRDVLKLLESAIANAENNHELVADELRVGKAYVDEGPTLKRYRPRALGRATRIRKRTSHLTIELVSKE